MASGIAIQRKSFRCFGGKLAIGFVSFLSKNQFFIQLRRAFSGALFYYDNKTKKQNRGGNRIHSWLVARNTSINPVRDLPVARLQLESRGFRLRFYIRLGVLFKELHDKPGSFLGKLVRAGVDESHHRRADF